MKAAQRTARLSAVTRSSRNEQITSAGTAVRRGPRSFTAHQLKRADQVRLGAH
jgi:hypothetical protein